MRVSLERTEKGWLARSVGAQGSGLVSSLTKADALALIATPSPSSASSQKECAPESRSRPLCYAEKR
jgi:molybdopterin molybdotransferase